MCVCIFFSSFSPAHQFVADFHFPISNRSERSKRGGNIPTLIMCLIRGSLHPDAFISRKRNGIHAPCSKKKVCVAERPLELFAPKGDITGLSEICYQKCLHGVAMEERGNQFHRIRRILLVWMGFFVVAFVCALLSYRSIKRWQWGRVFLFRRFSNVQMVFKILLNSEPSLRRRWQLNRPTDGSSTGRRDEHQRFVLVVVCLS